MRGGLDNKKGVKTRREDRRWCRSSRRWGSEPKRKEKQITHPHELSPNSTGDTRDRHLGAVGSLASAHGDGTAGGAADRK